MRALPSNSRRFAGLVANAKSAFAARPCNLGKAPLRFLTCAFGALLRVGALHPFLFGVPPDLYLTKHAVFPLFSITHLCDYWQK